MSRSLDTTLLAGALAAIVAFSPAPAAAQRKSAQEQRKQQMAQLPICARPLGTLSVIEPDDATNWWTGQQLPAPSKLIKRFVSKSRCFTLVDRGAGIDAAMRERELSYGGELRSRANVGKGQIKAADYVMVPDLIAQNEDAGGNAVGALLGGLIGGGRGAALGGALNLRKKTADVVLTVTDVRSSEQVAIAEGSAKKTDLGFGAGLGVLGGGLGGAGLGGYANTEIGQVITLAYLQAYTDIIAQLGGLPADASAANAGRAVTVNKPARLFQTAAGKRVVRSLDVGMLLYPTGAKQGMMWEVEDELGNRGWVSSTLLESSKFDQRDDNPGNPSSPYYRSRSDG